MATEEPSLALATFAQNVLYARAQGLAHSGHLVDAERTLRSLLGTDFKHEPLDLLARILAQQGRYREAGDLWEKALRLNSSNARVRRARDTAVSMTLWRRLSRPLVAAAFAAAFLGAMSLWILKLAASGDIPGAAQTASAISDPIQAPRRLVFPALPSWRQDDTQNFIRLEPENALFASATIFTPAGRHALDALVDRIRDDADIVLEIQGTTDTLPIREGARYRDNDELATARAGAVANYIRQASGVSPRSVTIRPGRTSLPSVHPKSSASGDGLRGVMVYVRK